MHAWPGPTRSLRIPAAFHRPFTCAGRWRDGTFPAGKLTGFRHSASWPCVERRVSGAVGQTADPPFSGKKREWPLFLKPAGARADNLQAASRPPSGQNRSQSRQCQAVAAVWRCKITFVRGGVIAIRSMSLRIAFNKPTAQVQRIESPEGNGSVEAATGCSWQSSY